jgi:hypothetical protein
MDIFYQEIAVEELQRIAASFQGFADGPTFVFTEQFA